MLVAVGWSCAHAEFHLFKIQQIYSNADGTVQFVVLRSIFENEHRWKGHFISGAKTFTFPADLPDAATNGRSVLVATQGFADLGIVAPDYIVPNNFISTTGGTVDFAGVDNIEYQAGELPTDGVNALLRSGAKAKNLATNFAGATGSVELGPASVNYGGIWWNAPANSESGWGINFQHDGNLIFATWFTYDAAGKPWWLVMTATQGAGSTFTGTLYKTTGSGYDAATFTAGTPVEAGTGTLTFTDANNATFAYNVTGFPPKTKTLTRQVFGTLPTCTYDAAPNFAAATNYQGLWWNASESGWGINFAHQGTTIFASWFTFDVDRSPLWLVATMSKGTGQTFSGRLYRMTATPFGASPFVPDTPADVGSATLSFANGNSATFSYKIDIGPVSKSKQITRQPLAAPPAGTRCN